MKVGDLKQSVIKACTSLQALMTDFYLSNSYYRWGLKTIQKVCLSVVDEFYHELSEEGVLPCEPGAGVT